MPEPTAAALIAEARELCEKATRDPWTKNGLSVVAEGRGVIANIPTPSKGGVFDCSDNVEFIARSHTLLPLLADKLEALEKEAARTQRLTDLVRYQRQELHVAGLITDEEYFGLAKDHAAVARLESYDETRAALTAAQGRIAQLESNQRFGRFLPPANPDPLEEMWQKTVMEQRERIASLESRLTKAREATERRPHPKSCASFAAIDREIPWHTFDAAICKSMSGCGSCEKCEWLRTHPAKPGECNCGRDEQIAILSDPAVASNTQTETESPK